MNYEQSIDYIHSIPKFCRPLGNANLEKLLTHLGNPQKKLKFIHIAGTNGKGSTAAMTAEILKKSGFKTGLFTSPYLEVFNERIRINGENITDNDLAEYVTRVKAIMEKTTHLFRNLLLSPQYRSCIFMKNNVILSFLKSVWAVNLTQRTL